jgi:hypothetical protein
MAESSAMTKKGASLPDTKEIDSKAVSAAEEARGLSVATRPEYERAGAFLIALKDIEREIDATFDPVTKAAYEAHRAAIAARDKHREPIREAEKIIKEKMGGFQRIEEKRLREEEVRLRELAKQEEEQDRLKAAQVLIEDGRADEALALLEGEVETPPIYMPETSAPKVKGIVTREVWKFRIKDPSKIPCDYHTVDEAKIRTVVRATEGKIVIPGVEIYMEKEIAAGGRR